MDAVIGGYRNIEAQELKLQGKTPVVMNVEDYGVPAYDELVIVAHRDAIHEAKIRKFLTALQAGVGYLRAHPQKSWEAFAAAHPELRTELNHRAWLQPCPCSPPIRQRWIKRATRLTNSFYITISW